MTSNAAGPWKILVVSNSHVEQKLLNGLLTRHHHQVLVFEDANQVLAQLAAGQVDAVIVDAMLSSMSGLELLEEIRRQELQNERERVPIVALTEDQREGDLCLNAGADLVLSRPLQMAEFHDGVRAAQPSHKTGSAFSGGEVIDWQVALDAVGGRRDLLRELVDIFGSEYPETLVAIRAAIDERDSKRLQMSAHQLKGCLRYFGSTSAGNLARQLEDMGRSGKLDGASNLLEPLTDAVERLWPKLQKGPEDA